ncbi:hypothetical protein Palpr_0581 [Paludibacter propionicigenes WB4]|uniref:TonB-dependent receptor plug n=1 Tax=Paludibacter propionicigenes (strain DSM 17365 / JCM 13257 / WB4) TaxID=694427 RepID=E4T1Z3_PALPW|nr:hypothetical protein [Paludibacter propionicigenes]ADQ78737.1 hypothetical protein Palpr_0581 [Paludibacter propionicigenes WB4]
MNKKTTGFLLLSFCLITQLAAQVNDTTLNKLTRYLSVINHFSRNLPQEKVYVHMDNTCYYQGDDIWFSCYLVNSGQHQAGQLSKTLYVELLNPGGEVVETQILKVENSRCHGNFSLNKLPFYSGYYEVRAYTKYMLNFGEETIFSRIFPVYDKPKKQGDYAEKSLLEYGRGKYPMFRPKPVKEKKVTVKLFPEGGHLVQGLSSRVAFEATDAYGNPIDITGEIIGENKESLVYFKTTHAGRGVFTYTPANKVQSDDKAPKISVNYQNRTYQFDLPAVQPAGVVLSVDNLSSPDSIGIRVQSYGSTAGKLYGLVLMSGSTLQKHVMIDLSAGKPISFNIDKTNLPAGVSRIVLFNSAGQSVADRLLFVTQNEKLTITEKADKASYQPHEQVNMQFSITEQDTIPVETTFSVSIRDKQNDVKPNQDIQSNLLLMSEIRGYVHNPDYYFESTDSIHRQALDQLLMVQGWHRFDWDWVSGKKPFELKHRPEKAIEVQGQVVSFVKSVPKPKVNVSTLITQKNDSGKVARSFMENFVTDSLGRFRFAADVEGRWDLVFAVKEKGKTKDYRTVLDKLFSPEPKRYLYSDLFANIPPQEVARSATKDSLIRAAKDSTPIAIPKINYDSIAKKGVQGKMLHLKEVVVQAKKYSKEKDILDARKKSAVHYDVYAEQDKMRDKGDVGEQYLNDFLIKTNKDFFMSPSMGSVEGKLIYKNRLALVVVDYKAISWEETLKIPLYLRMSYIKSVYVSEDNGAKVDYGDPMWKPMDKIAAFSCVVFIEIFPDWVTPTEPAKGVRKTWMDGYSQVKEFYSPNYSILPPEADYRRTLYWNPSVKTNKEGKALIQFYNNSSCKSFSISAETITPQGVMGVLKK